MSRRIRSFVSVFGLTALLALPFVLGSGQVSAQDATASPMGEDMGDCVNIIHASPDAQAVDVTPKGGDALISDLSFPDASDYLDVPADTYDLEVRPTGTMDVALDLPSVELEAGMVYDIFAVGTLSDGSLTVLVIPSTTTAPEMATPAS